MSEDRSIASVVLHPVRVRIIQQLGGQTMTTVQLRAALPDVTQATLYRHIAALLEAEVVAVVGERQVRGAVERTLALGERMALVDQEGLQEMDDVQLRSAFLVFLSGLSSDFERVLDSEDAASRDLLGFTRAPLYLDADDLETLQAEFMRVVTPYLHRRTAEQRRIGLATVLLPEVLQ